MNTSMTFRLPSSASIIVACSLFFANVSPSHAMTQPVDVMRTLDIGSRAVAVYDEEDREILAAKDADRELALASLTKLMTALVVLDLQPQWDKVVTFGKNDVRPGARLAIRPGEQLTVRDLFQTMLIGSANNATVALVHATGLRAKQFVQKMNEKASELGLTHTRFVEPTGLQLGNISTAEEYAYVASEALQQPAIRAATTMRAYTFRTRNTKVFHRIRNSNLLLQNGFPLQGGKTGYLTETGHSLVLRTSTGGRSIITVVLHNPTSWGRFAEAKMLAQQAALFRPQEE